MEAHEEADKNGNLAALQKALSAGAAGQVAAALKPLHPAQIADFLEALPAEERVRLWKLIGPAVKEDILVKAHGEVRRQLIEESGPEEIAAAVQRLDLDELSDIHEELPEEVVEAVLRAMDDQRRWRFDVVRTYPEDTAAGLIDVDAITVRPDVTLRMVLNYLGRCRAEHNQIPEHTNAIMVVDLDGRYLGQLQLSDLVSLDPERKVHDVMDRGVAAITADTAAVRVARLFQDRDLVSAPVVDEQEKLIGRITVDDVIDIIREEAEHSVMATAGLDEEADTFAPAVTSARRRAITYETETAGGCSRKNWRSEQSMVSCGRLLLVSSRAVVQELQPEPGIRCCAHDQSGHGGRLGDTDSNAAPAPARGSGACQRSDPGRPDRRLRISCLSGHGRRFSDLRASNRKSARSSGCA